MKRISPSAEMVMTRKQNFEIQIAKPCSERWDLMQSRGANRYCDHCCREVLDTSSMTLKEVELLALRRAAGEPICARIQTNAEGQLVLREEARTSRPLLAAKAAMSVALAAGMPAAAQSSSTEEHLPPCGPIPKADEIVTGCERPQPPATVTGRLLRPDGSAVNSGLVYLNGEGKSILYVVDELGSFELHEKPGTYDIVVQTGPDQAEHIGVVKLHDGFQSFGDVQTKYNQGALVENYITITVGELSSVLRWSWKSRLRHPLLYVKYLFRRNF